MHHFSYWWLRHCCVRNELWALFLQLGTPEAAIFKVGRFGEHPDIPDNLSEEAKSFLLGLATQSMDRTILLHVYYMCVLASSRLVFVAALKLIPRSVPQLLTSLNILSYLSKPVFLVYMNCNECTVESQLAEEHMLCFLGFTLTVHIMDMLPRLFL